MDKRPGVLSTNIFFLLTGLSLIFLGGFFQSRNIYTGLLITEYLLILVPSVLFLKIKKLPLKETLRLNRISFKQLVTVILISIVAYPLAVLFQAVFLSILSRFTPLLEIGVPIPSNIRTYFISIFVFAIGPGICEEIMFRGVLTRAYEGFGIKKSIIVTSILFGIFHFNIFNLVGPIFLGIIFGITLYKTNSIYAPIVGHIINNSIAVTLGYIITRNAANMDANMIENQSSLEVTGIIILIIFLLSCTYMLIKLIKNLGDMDDLHIEYEDTKVSSVFYFFPVVIVVFLFIYLNYRLLSII